MLNDYNLHGEYWYLFLLATGGSLLGPGRSGSRGPFSSGGGAITSGRATQCRHLQNIIANVHVTF